MDKHILGNLLKIDIEAPASYPTTLKHDDIISYRTVLELITPKENESEPKVGTEKYTMTLAMIVMVVNQIKDHVITESDKMEIAQVEYVSQRASKLDKQIRLQPLINLLDKILERLQPIS